VTDRLNGSPDKTIIAACWWASCSVLKQTRPEHCLRIHYEVGDICLFDNHKIQHYAVSDYHPHPRRILRMSFAPQKIIAG
jgi:hypothetical protein